MFFSQDLRRLARALCAAATFAAATAAAPAAAQSTTLGEGDPLVSGTLCPADDAVPVASRPVSAVDSFTLSSTGAGEVVDRVYVTLSPAGAYTFLDSVEVRSGDLGTTYGSIVPSGDSVNFAVTPISVGGAAVQYRLVVRPKAHSTMPAAAPGQQQKVSGRVTNVRTKFSKVLQNAVSATLTIGNDAPPNLSWSSVTTTATSINLSWNGTQDVVVLRRLGGPVVESLADGAAYTAGSPLGGSTVAFRSSAAASYDNAGLTSGKPYYYRAFVRDLCGNFSSGTAIGPVYPGGTAEGDLTPNSRRPVVGILNPTSGTVTSPFRVQVRVVSPNDAGGSPQAIGAVTLNVDDGTTSNNYPLTRNANYGADVDSGVFEAGTLVSGNFTGLTLAPGRYTIRAQASNAAGAVSSGPVGVVVTSGRGDGNLLVRDNSSQLCGDCHAIRTHSSEATGNEYGSWYVGCRACHAPHGTPNASLVAGHIAPPGVNGIQPPSKIQFSKKTGYYAGDPALNPGDASFANAATAADPTARRTGVCQVCHTRTDFYRADGTGAAHFTGNCMDCHAHSAGMAPGGCNGCHGTTAARAFASETPPNDTCGNSAPNGADLNNRVGAHEAHLVGGFSDGVLCGECHTNPPARAEHPSRGPLPSCDGTSSRALLTWGSVATAGGTIADVSWNPATQTCSSTYCHGNFPMSGKAPGSVTWGGAVACGDCHENPPSANHDAGDTDCALCHGTGYDLAGISGPALATHVNGTVEGSGGSCTACHLKAADLNSWAYGDSQKATINETEWTSRGHGSSLAGPETCLYCHDDSADHNVATNPFRLRGVSNASGVTAAFDVGVSAGNAICLNCHQSNDGVDPDDAGTGFAREVAAKKISAWHAGGLHAAGTDGGTRCYDCHDPHGDTNIRMIGSDVLADAADPYGFAGTRAATPVVFTNRAAGTDYAKSAAPFNGVCNVCHVATSHYTATFGDGHGSGAMCTTCHAHDAGAQATAFTPSVSGCGACHSSPPNVGKHLAHDQVASLPTAYGDLAAHATATQYGYGCGKCHGTAAGNHMNDVGGTPADPYRVNVVLDGGGTYVAGGTVNQHAGGLGVFGWTDGSGCSANYCHDPQGAAYAAANVTFNQAGALNCASCHDDDTATTLSGRHAKHVDAAGYNQPCNRCHAATSSDGVTITDKRQHADGGKDVSFDGFNPSGVFASPNCSSTYCHSNGTPLGGSIAYAAAIGWTGTVNATCTSCHGGDSTSGTNLATNKHPQHVNQAAVLGVNYGCVDCHNATVTANRTLVSPPTSHVNGAKNVGFPTRGGQASAAYASPSCNTNYCHSNGRDPAATDAARYANVQWDQPGALACNGCHGRGNATGAPDYVDGATLAEANSHAKHTTGGSTTCVSCHSGLVNAAGTAIVGSSHTNGVRNVAFLDGGSYDLGAKSCSSIACHANAVWGDPTTMNCSSCHVGTGDVNNFNIADSTKSQLDSGQWTSFGHGSSAGAFSEFSGATNRCTYCHDDQNASADHGQVGNPFRLRGASTDASGATGLYSTATAATTNAACTNCHGTGTIFGVNPDGAGGQPLIAAATTKIDAYHHADKHSPTADGGQRCWDCHDPHGDGTNIKMIGTDLLADAADAHGLTGTRAPTSVVFTANTTGTDYAKSVAPFNGICNVCHAASGTVAHYDRDSGDGHNSGQACTACHSHQQPLQHNAFYAGESSGGTACFVCHPTDPTTGAKYQAMQSDNTLYHHVMASDLPTYPTANGSNTCVSCHSDHDIFRPDLNASNTKGRGANLRTRITQGPTQSGPGDAAGRYDNTDFNSTGNVSVCISCHSTSLPKNTTAQKSDGTTAVAAVSAADYGASKHQYAVAGQIKKDSSPIQANCMKCHSDPTATGYPQYQPGPISNVSTATFYLDPAAPSDPQPSGHETTGDAPAPTMTNQLYFKPSAEELPLGNLPTGHLVTTDSFTGGTWVARSMSPNAATVAYETRESTATANIAASTQYWRRVSFFSPTVASNTTLAAANWTMNIWGYQNSTNANARVRYAVYSIDSAGALKTTFHPRTTYATGWTAIAAPGNALNFTTANSISGSLDAGDRVVVDLEIQTTNSSTTNRTVAYTFGTSASSYVTMGTTNVPWNSGASIFAGGTWAGRSLGVSAPTAAAESYDSTNATLTTATTQLWARRTFVTPAVGSATTLAAQPWTINLYGRQSAATANAYYRYLIYRLNADGTKGPDIVPRTRHSVAMPVAASGVGTLQTITTAAGSAVSLAAGDKIVLDVEIQTVNPTTTSAALVLSYGSGAASTLVSPTVVPFQIVNPSVQQFALHTNPDRSLRNPLGMTPTDGYEENFCFRCHSNAGQATPGGGAAKTVADRDYFNSTAMSPASQGIFSAFDGKARGHKPGSYSLRHKATGEDGAYLAGASGMHVECEDCHSPHAAKAGRHTKGSNIAGAALTGAAGRVPAAKTTNWNTTNYTYTDTTVGATTPEAYVCFRCHSSSNTAIPHHPGTNATPQNAVAPWNSTTYGFTNVAHEFQQSNASYHPVLGPLPATDPGANGSNRLTAAQLVGIDRSWTPGDTMTCTDCHGTDAGSAAAQGPHGSAIGFMLTGTNRAWPYQNAGATSGTLWSLYNSESPTGANGLFCRNCHPRPYTSGTTGSNWWHGQYGGEGSSRHPGNCVGCHIRVPHGGKVSRLIVTTNAPARYKVSGQAMLLDGFRKAAGSSSTFNDGPGCSEHSSGTSLEAW